MWRKIAKIVLWISVVVVELCVLFILVPTFYKMFDNSVFMAVIIFLAGTAINAMINSFLGATLDCFEDVSNIRSNIYQIKDIQRNSESGSSDSLSSLERLKRISNDETSDGADFWNCRACGERNKGLDLVCKSCGKYK